MGSDCISKSRLCTMFLHWKSRGSAIHVMAVVLRLSVLAFAAVAVVTAQDLDAHIFGPFNSSYYQTFAVVPPATISNEALQITPDSVGNFRLDHRSGRVLFNRPYKLWEEKKKVEVASSGKIASFNTSFLVNIYRVNNSIPGEGFAFLIAPDLELPPSSDGGFLGLTNSSTDGRSDNGVVAVELDTVKQGFDPDNNHLGLDINSVRSNKTVSLYNKGIEIAPDGTIFHVVWIQYDGENKTMDVYMAEQSGRNEATPPRPAEPILSAPLDLRDHVKQHSYFGFAASTGGKVQLNCVLKWNLTVELLPGEGGRKNHWVKIGVASAVALLAVLMGIAGMVYYLYRKKKLRSDPKILNALESLPGTPREFKFSELKKATNNFDEKNKLGQGGFGVVYRGLLSKENLEIAVKKFSRDDLNSKDDFLAELTIINRLRHKHLVRLLGWCHRGELLLLVYVYMPNGSLDHHLYRGSEDSSTELGWSLRYKIVSGVASALQYLHNEYDQTVVHRDLKASNIMLDADFTARLGDFGLARALEHEKTSYAELEGIPGTFGYIAPECFHTAKATRESDVYAFGAVLLEVVCGKRPWTKVGEFQALVDWVWCLYREGRVLEAVDPRLGNDYVAEEAERLLLLGLACSHPIGRERPKTHTIVQILSGSVAIPPVPHFKPAFVWPAMPMPGSISLTTSSNTGYTSDTTPITSGYSDKSSIV